MKKQDYRIFAKNPKQNFVFKLLLDYINTGKLECYSDRIRNHVMELFNSYKAGKLSNLWTKATTFRFYHLCSNSNSWISNYRES